MPNWQLTLVILASVFVGALIPLLVMMAVALHRASREIAQVGARLQRTLGQVEPISDRVEVLSRGLKGGETTIADLLTTVGHVAAGLEHNMKVINMTSTIIATVATAVTGFLKARSPEPSSDPLARDANGVPDNGAPPSPHDASHSPKMGTD